MIARPQSLLAFLLSISIGLAGCTSASGPESVEDQPPSQTPSLTTAPEPENAEPVQAPIRENFSASYTPAVGATLLISEEPVSISNGDTNIDLPANAISLEAYMNWTSTTGVDEWRFCLEPQTGRGERECRVGSSPLHVVIEPRELPCNRYQIIVEYAGPLVADTQPQIDVEGWFYRDPNFPEAC